MYIAKIDDIVEKYNNTYHLIIKIKPFNVESRTYNNFVKKIMIKTLNLKLEIIWEYQNI